jgi:hypothetical protein
VVEDVRRDPRRRALAVARRVVAQHLDRERGIRVRHRLAEQAQVAPRAATQIDQRARAELAARVRRGAHRVEPERQHAPEREIVAVLGALVDRLGGLPHAPLHRALGEHVEQRRAALGIAALVQRDQDLAEPQPRRRERRALGGGERLAARQLAPGGRLVGQPARRDRGVQPVDRERAIRHGDRGVVAAVLVAIVIGRRGRQLAAAVLGIILRQVAHEQLAELRSASGDRALHVTEHQHRGATTVCSR